MRSENVRILDTRLGQIQPPEPMKTVLPRLSSGEPPERLKIYLVQVQVSEHRNAVCKVLGVAAAARCPAFERIADVVVPRRFRTCNEVLHST